MQVAADKHLSNPKLGHTTAGREGRRKAGCAGRVGSDGTPTGLPAQETSVSLVLQSIEKMVSIILRKHGQANSNVNPRKNKTRG